MIRKTFQKKTKCLVLVITVLSFLTLNTNVYAQGPNAPEAASFEPVDATDMVNLVTGDLSYVLPLLNVPSPEGGYPIALSYHAGIAMEQEASWVGLGWSLNPGAINRNVNGDPDDWKYGQIRETAYDEGGSVTSTSVSIGYGVPGKWSVGVGVSWGSNRSFGGSVSASIGGTYGSIGTYGISGGFGLNNNFGVGASVGFNGSVGIGVNFGLGKDSANSLSLAIGYGPGGLNGSLGISQKNREEKGQLLNDGKSSGIGISLSSSGIGISTRSQGIGTSIQSGFNRPIGASDYNVRNKTSGFMAVTPWGYFSFGKNKMSWDLKSITNYHGQGSIFTGLPGRQTFGDGSNGIVKVSNLKSGDTYELNTESIFEQSRESQYTKTNNGAFSNFDNYNVASQGISGSITPTIANNLSLRPFLGGSFENILVGSIQPNNFPDALKPVHFNFQSFNSSYLNVLPFDMSYSGGEVSLNTSSITSTLPNGYSYNQDQSLIYHQSSYSETDNKKREGRFIEYFTVEDINSGFAAAKGFLDVENNFQRDLDACGYTNTTGWDNLNFESSIGAFKITAADGKTYHYSLPVYQGEQVRRLYGIVDGKNENQAHMDRMHVDPYVTHWLLTAITGPDYIKNDVNRKYPDEDDYGYWIRFDYGKWSNGYVWKTPGGQYSENTDVFEKVKQYSWGRKQIYYLDKIKTRTHTAIFSKKLRLDNKSQSMTYKNLFHYEIPSASYMAVTSHPLLSLDKIILLNNEDANAIDKSSGSPLIASKHYNYYVSGIHSLHTINHSSYYAWDYSDKYLKQYQVNNNNDVLDENDLIGLNIENKALKVIKFNHDYSLAHGVPNSSAGKLTLNSVHVKGKEGIGIIPPIKFNYTSNYSYDVDKKNDYGYYKNQPQAWSLNKITTPTGGNINITYEPDSYNKVAIKNGRVFTSKLKFTFLTEPPRGYGDDYASMESAPEGITRIKIEVDDQDLKAQGILFSDYFDISQTFFMDMWYSAVFNHSGAGYDRSSVNINAKQASIVELNTSQNYMIVDVMASSPAFRDVFQHGTEPVSVLYATNDYVGVDNHNLPRFELAWNPTQGHRQYSMRHTVIGNKIKPDNNSGIRVKQITVNDNTGNTYNTNYNYNNPETGETSGIIPYYPEPNYAVNQQAPYISLLPGPIVTYKYVTESSNDVKRLYKFNVLEEINTSNNSVSFGDLLQIECSEENPTNDINLKYVTVKNNLQSLGRIEEIKILNKEDQIVTHTENNYASINDYFSLGQFQESSYTAKLVTHYENNSYSTVLNSKSYYNVSSKIDIASNLESTTTTQGGFTSTTNFIIHDFLTGQVLETTTTDSKGNEFKTKLIPAYTIAAYSDNLSNYGMGSKVDNITNKNMLTQEAMTKSYIKVGNDWKETGVGITTWNNDWVYTDYKGDTNHETTANKKIWRKHKSFIWNGGLNPDGTLNGFTGDDDSFVWMVGPDIPQTNTEWKNVSTTTQYDHNSMPLEVKDINDNYASTKTCDNDSKVLTVSNAGYTEMYYSGAEYFADDGETYFDGQVKASPQSSTHAHTGFYSIIIDPGLKGFEVNLPDNTERTGLKSKFKVSVWVRKDNYINARIHVNGALRAFKGEQVFAGDWVQLNHYEELSSGVETVYVTSAVGKIRFDDFRLYPITSSMTGYVYNQWDELWYIIGNNGLASKFEYDEAGRLIKTYAEVIDDGTVTGGFKLTSENKYTYKY